MAAKGGRLLATAGVDTTTNDHLAHPTQSSIMPLHQKTHRLHFLVHVLFRSELPTILTVHPVPNHQYCQQVSRKITTLHLRYSCKKRKKISDDKLKSAAGENSSLVNSFFPAKNDHHRYRRDGTKVAVEEAQSTFPSLAVGLQGHQHDLLSIVRPTKETLMLRRHMNSPHPIDLIDLPARPHRRHKAIRLTRWMRLEGSRTGSRSKVRPVSTAPGCIHNMDDDLARAESSGGRVRWLAVLGKVLLLQHILDDRRCKVRPI